MSHAGPYTFAEVRSLGIDAFHEDPEGRLFIWTGSYCLRIDPQTGVAVRLGGLRRLPESPWHPTAASRPLLA